MSPLAIADVIAELERGGLPIDHHDENGLSTLCQLCPGWVIWTEDLQRFVCSRSECPGHENPSLHVDAFYFKTKRPEGFASNRGVEPNPEGAKCHAPRELALGTLPDGARFTTRKLDASEFRPVEFAWEQRLVRGVLNVLAGTEGIGKGTLISWVIAQLTRGGLPGQFRGKPARVLWLGDEDSWSQVVGPRLYAANADLSMVEEMSAPDGRLYNVHEDAAELDRIITTGGFDIVVFEALLDHMPSGRGGDPTQHVRGSLAPTRAVLRRRGTTALATMHTRKGPSSSFRDLMAGSHQYNALSRSSLLLAVHPDDEDRRIVVAGKQNYSRAAVTESFELVEHGFELNDHRFSVSLARDFQPEPEITIDSLLSTPRREVRDEAADVLLAALNGKPTSWADWARAAGFDSKHGTARRAREELADAGLVHQAKGMWTRKTEDGS